MEVYTINNTRDSSWVPYEYGRISERPQDWLRAACYVPNPLLQIPDYMELGIVAKNELDVKHWLKKEYQKW